jgi:hypothetical protein
MDWRAATRTAAKENTMRKGDRVSWDGGACTVEGFTKDGMSVVVRTDDGDRVYVPRPVVLSGITTPLDVTPPRAEEGGKVEP